MERRDGRRWPRHSRDLDGAWRAVEDLRDEVDELVRRLDRIALVQDKYVPLVEDLLKSDEIAEAVAKKMDENQTRRLSTGNFALSKWQTRAAIAAVSLTALGLVLNALASAGVL